MRISNTQKILLDAVIIFSLAFFGSWLYFQNPADPDPVNPTMIEYHSIMQAVGSIHARVKMLESRVGVTASPEVLAEALEGLYLGKTGWFYSGTLDGDQFINSRLLLEPGTIPEAGQLYLIKSPVSFRESPPTGPFLVMGAMTSPLVLTIGTVVQVLDKRVIGLQSQVWLQAEIIKPYFPQE